MRHLHWPVPHLRYYLYQPFLFPLFLNRILLTGSLGALVKKLRNLCLKVGLSVSENFFCVCVECFKYTGGTC